jgi:aminopeptidase N
MPSPVLPLRPRHYRLRIEPDASLSRFRGQVTIALEAAEPARSVVLQALGLEIEAIHLEHAGRRQPAGWSLAETAESLRVELPAAVSGPFAVVIAYAGTIGQGMAGFYRSAYGSGAERRPLAVTQFQESDARRAFPCLDHPRYKATFDVELVVAAGLEGISNGPLEKVIELADGRRGLHFGRTPVMSTYLVFWAVGTFETAIHKVDPRLRAVTGPGDVHLAESALDFGARALAFCEHYFGIPYPLAKLDLIAVPDFAFGAMENWGAMTFRENLLLDDPARTSRAGRERIRETVAHEITHQWFGNLVTPEEWTYLWLNESFATYFGYGIVDHQHPDWGVWDQFLLSQTAPALERDALGVDTPIEIPGGEHLVINTSTAPIIYSKGGSLLRQFRAHLGEEGFRRGLQGYLSRHAYDCASSRDFWQAFDAPGAESPLALMRPWVEQPGFPLVTARRDGAWLHLHQARFTYRPADQAILWPIPLGLQTLDARGRGTSQRSVLSVRETAVPLGDAAAYLLNAGRTGFFRVHYADPANLEALGRLSAALEPVDRWGLQEDLFALVRAGAVPAGRYLEWLETNAGETADLPLSGMAHHVLELFRVLHRRDRESVAAVGKRLGEAVLERIGLDPRSGEPHGTARLRDELLWPAVVYGASGLGARLRERLRALAAGADLHPDLLKGVLQAGAWLEGMAFLDPLVERFQKAAGEHERLAVLTALGSFQDPEALRQAWEFVVGAVPGRIGYVALVAMAANPSAGPHLWGWLAGSRSRLEDFHPLLFERVLASLIPAAGLAEAQRVEEDARELLLGDPPYADAVRLALERLAINRRLRQAGLD